MNTKLARSQDTHEAKIPSDHQGDVATPERRSFIFLCFEWQFSEKGRAYNIPTHDNHWRVPWEQNNTKLGGAILSDTKYPPIPKGDNLWFVNCPHFPPQHEKNRAAKLAATVHKPKFHLLVQKVQTHISNMVIFWHSRAFLEGLLYIITFFNSFT